MTTKTPAGLKASGKRLYLSVADHYDLEEHERAMLVEAARVADRLEALSVALADAPLTVTNARGDKAAQPLLGEARQQQLVLSRLIASLRLPAGDEEGRPQRRGASRASYGVRGVV